MFIGLDANLNFLVLERINPENLSEIPPSFPTLASLSSSELSLFPTITAVPSLSRLRILLFFLGELLANF